MRSIVVALIALAFCASTAQAQEVKVLVYHGPPDATSAAGTAAIEALGADNGFTVDESADAADISEANLADYRAVVFLNTAGNLLDETQEGALRAFVKGGGGFLGIGSAAQGESGNSFFDGLIGARPAGSSSTEETEQTVEVGDRVHPATRDLPLTLDRTDVWYQWENRPTGTVHVVARYRAPDAPAGDGTDVGGTDHPISWCRDYEGGRSFYTGMGRIAGAYDEADFRKHLLGALQWTTGLVRANCKATINSNYESTRLTSGGPTGTGLATAGESHGLVVAPNGWVISIGRGDCRTDAERGQLLGGSAVERIFDYSNPNVGIGCGDVHVWDPSEYDGTVNSGNTLAGVLAVYGDMGGGEERTNQQNHKTETGLIGITLAPDFTETGHIYLQYYPTFNESTLPPGLPEQYRIHKMSKPRISRFTMDLETKQLDLRSEVRIFEYDAQVFSCCHRGGGMGFDSKGNLYVTTGDSNSSQGTGGYSGNNPDAHCPTGPADEASNEHCGDNGISYQDARRTAGNTNDYNGKMLRFKPMDIPDGEQPPVGIGTTYTIPGADAPNGPNLFDGTEGGGGKAKPEIYAMGLRNPSRLSIDPETDVPYSGWVGPDAGAPSRELGPSTYETLTQIDRAGNYGWPYCMGSKQAYRDRVPGNTARTSNEPGYVPGGPAEGGTDGWYDCDNLVNDSPNNTGLTTLPHETGTGMDAGKVRPVNLWYSRGNPNDANGCPQFPRPRGENTAPDYGADPEQLCPYAINAGMTVMDGPVYRYDDEAGDDSRRWPQYWDGRWFIWDWNNNSVRHAVMLDPATDQDGSQPIYADSLRSLLSWQGNLMDSKFGPDGALYLQMYDGFFRANPNVGLYRVSYVGGSDTPGASPKGTPIGAYKVSFSSAGSGGVAYEWDFGDGSEPSTEANPVHTYAEAKRYTAKLTVTYADGGTDSKTVDVDVLAEADEDAPVTTAALDPSEPGAGGTYTGPVTVTLSATDPAGGSGLDRTEYRINGGEFQRYDDPIRRSQPGMYLIEYRSVDRTGNEEDLKSVAFTIAVPQNCPTNLNDEFDGPELDPKWQILRDDPSARSMVDGGLKLLVRAGDMIGDTATAKNVLLQDAPPGSWVIQTKLDVSTLTDSGQQAGFVLWNGEDPNTFAKITYISKGSFNQFEWVATRNDASDIHAGPQSTQAHDVAYLRVSSNGSGTYVPEGSFDGENWVPISSPITDLGDPSTLKFGLKISDNSDSDSSYALFDWFRVDCSDRVPPTTTATLSPDEPDGELGWYTSAPTVTLAADDGELGEVDRIEYTVDGGDSQTYNGPFQVSGPGDHVVEYFATDTAGNVETVKTAAFRVDGAAPVTEASISGDGDSRTVTLDASDGDDGSGVVLTQYRVDGGPWTAYASKDEQILDASDASLAQWQQAPSGHFERMDDGSGGITPVGGLGMLWYPVKAYGDFKVKLQFREGRTDGGHSNGGVFVRFPDPRGEAREPCEDYAAPGDDAWVAIYCGFEIQLYDGPDGEPRKTGSVYTFDNTDSEHMGTPKDVGEWEDYAIEVRGQHYSIYRNGELINEFQNDPGIEPDRAGDPSTSLRQFTRGYIGLQNHSTSDHMQYRNVRVEDLTPGAPGANPTGPFAVSGEGPHTIQVRSVDAAGNAEDSTASTFEIGSRTPPTTQPSPPAPIVLQPVMAPMHPPFLETPASYRLGQFGKRISVKTFARRGVRVPVECTGAMTGTAKVTVSRKNARRLHLGRRTLDRDHVQCWGPHSVRVSLKPSKSLARKLKARRGPRRVKLSITIQMRDWGKPATTIHRSVTLKRRHR
ncbi:MAG TPA: ThuA domain-containing protein [Solirubrobacter sp.]|nr:ThuA domain-containing protein [Solirubrobacter sp.]